MGTTERIPGLEQLQYARADHSRRRQVEQEERRAFVPLAGGCAEQMGLLPDRNDSKIRQDQEPLPSSPDMEKLFVVEREDGLSSRLRDLVRGSQLVRCEAERVGRQDRSTGEAPRA